MTQFFAGCVVGSAITLGGVGLCLAAAAAWIGAQWVRAYIRGV